MLGARRNASDTVITETPAASATCFIAGCISGAKQKQILDTLDIRVDAEELPLTDGRVVVFRVPPRPLGTPMAIKGQYLMRSGESLVPMTPDKLRQIFAEAQGPDFSAQLCLLSDNYIAPTATTTSPHLGDGGSTR